MTTSTIVKPSTTKHVGNLVTLDIAIRAVADRLKYLPMDRDDEAIDLVNTAIDKLIIAMGKFLGGDNFLKHAEQLFSNCRVPQQWKDPDFSILKIAVDKASAWLAVIVAQEQTGDFAEILPEIAVKALEGLIIASAACLGQGNDYLWVAEQLVD